jgi:hypothetical protein
LLRHLFAYGELVREETADALRLLQRRAVGLAVAVAAGSMALLWGCVWLVAANWDGPNRLRVLGALCIGFTLIALLGGWYAGTGRAPGQPRPFERLRAEWRADRQQLATLDPSLVEGDQVAAATAPAASEPRGDGRGNDGRD